MVVVCVCVVGRKSLEGKIYRWDAAVNMAASRLRFRARFAYIQPDVAGKLLKRRTPRTVDRNDIYLVSKANPTKG